MKRKTFDQFVNESMSDKEMDEVKDRVYREGMNLSQEEFNKLHDKLIADGLSASRRQNPKFTEDQHKKEAEQHMLTAMGSVFEVPPGDDEHYETTVALWPEFNRYYDKYSK